MLRTQTLDRASYMMCNAQEFWAESVQAWFGASVRTDVNCGINTRDAVRARLPALATVLEATYGDTTWSYHRENCHGWHARA